MGELFEKTDFSDSDESIENNLDPFGGWRLPTQEEWEKVVTNASVREGSTVNGTPNAHWAFIRLTGVTFEGSTTPYGLLVFPDGKTITGKTLVGVDDVSNSTTGVTSAELNAYLEQGCLFLPCASFYDTSLDDEGDPIGWIDGGSYRSNRESGDGGAYYLYFDNPSVNSGYEDNKWSYISVRLVKSVGE